MGGKGGGGGNYYQQPPDTSGYGTPEEAKVTLAKEAPIDYSAYEQMINVKKAAADATAKANAEKMKPKIPPLAEGESGTSETGDELSKAVLAPPDLWALYGQGQSPISRVPGTVPDPNMQGRDRQAVRQR
jgi:hypothetical protein